MDWLDRLSVAAAAVIILIAVGMLADREIDKRSNDDAGGGIEIERASYVQRMREDEKRYKGIVSRMAQGRYKEAMEGLKGIIKEDPRRSLSYVYLARLYLKEGNLAESTHSYRRAVEMEADYVDATSPMYIGKELTTLVAEGREKLGREKQLRPKDKEVRRALEDIYYLQRRLAGGCE